jgi:hypothetical protein
MEAKDLRIGNLVDWKISEITGEPQILRVVGIFEHSEDGEIILEEPNLKSDNPNDYHDTNVDDICGIPLTEKWLLKMGFHKRPEGFIGMKIKKKQYLEINIIEKRCIIFVEAGEFFPILFPENIHNVQNLWHSLTGQELTIN